MVTGEGDRDRKVTQGVPTHQAELHILPYGHYTSIKFIFKGFILKYQIMDLGNFETKKTTKHLSKIKM